MQIATIKCSSPLLRTLHRYIIFRNSVTKRSFQGKSEQFNIEITNKL